MRARIKDAAALLVRGPYFSRLRPMFDELERIANHVSDSDQECWPFLFLRPSPEARMSSTRLAVIAALYGIAAGLLVNVALRLTPGHALPSPFVFPTATTLGFFAIFRLTFAASRNRRAARFSRGGRG